MTSRRGATYDVVQAAIAIKVAKANEASANESARWARVAPRASIASVVVAIAAVVVAALG